MIETIDLQGIQTIEDYELICDRFPKEVLDSAWEKLSESEQERINLICSGGVSESQIINELINCHNLDDLKALKTRYDANLIKRAWNQIKRQNPIEFNRLNSMCNQETKTLCKGCGQPIKWAKKDDKFHPFNLDGSSHFGTCSKALDFVPKAEETKQKKAIDEMNLVDLNQEAQELFNQILEVSEDEESLIKVLETLQSKIDATAYIYDAFDVELASLKARREAILAKIDHQISRMENAQKAISTRLIYWHNQGLIPSKLIGNERQITLRNYPIVEVNIDPEKLPEQYRTEKVTYTPKKEVIKKALKEGEDLGLMAELKDNYKPQFGYKSTPKTKKK